MLRTTIICLAVVALTGACKQRRADAELQSSESTDAVDATREAESEADVAANRELMELVDELDRILKNRFELAGMERAPAGVADSAYTLDGGTASAEGREALVLGVKALREKLADLEASLETLREAGDVTERRVELSRMVRELQTKVEAKSKLLADRDGRDVARQEEEQRAAQKLRDETTRREREAREAREREDRDRRDRAETERLRAAEQERLRRESQRLAEEADRRVQQLRAQARVKSQCFDRCEATKNSCYSRAELTETGSAVNTAKIRCLVARIDCRESCG